MFMIAERPTTLVSNKRLNDWVDEMVALCKPDHVYWCDGSQEEYDLLCEGLVDAGTFLRLNPKLRPNSFLVSPKPTRDRPTIGCNLER
jgi:phosphoenolpyruvate carboxykinase (GTP)